MSKYKRDYWAFCVGMSVMGAVFGYLCSSPTLFLFNGLVGLFDAYMWDKERKNGENNPS